MKKLRLNFLKAWSLRVRALLTKTLRTLLWNLDNKDLTTYNQRRRDSLSAMFLTKESGLASAQGKTLFFNVTGNLFLLSNGTLPVFDVVAPGSYYVKVLPRGTQPETISQYLFSSEEIEESVTEMNEYIECFINHPDTSKLLLIPFEQPLNARTLDKCLANLIQGVERVSIYKT